MNTLDKLRHEFQRKMEGWSYIAHRSELSGISQKGMAHHRAQAAKAALEKLNEFAADGGFATLEILGWLDRQQSLEREKANMGDREASAREIEYFHLYRLASKEVLG